MLKKQQNYTMVANQIHSFGQLHQLFSRSVAPHFFAIKWPCSKWVHPIFWGHEFCWICMKNWRDHRQCNAPLVSAEMGDRCVKFSPRPKDCSHVISILSTKPRTLQDCFLFRLWVMTNKDPSNMIPIPHVFFTLSMFCTRCFYLTDCLSIFYFKDL